MLGESGGLKARYEVSGPFARDKWAELNFQYQNPTNASQQVVPRLYVQSAQHLLFPLTNLQEYHFATAASDKA